MRYLRLSTIIKEDEYNELISLLRKADSVQEKVLRTLLDGITEIGPIPKEWKTNVVVFDLDGTACEFTELLEDIGNPYYYFAEIVNMFHERGYRVGIYTARPDEQKERIREFFLKKNIEIDFIQEDSKGKWKSSKPNADLYFCDRTFFFTGLWDKDIKRIKLLLEALEA